MSLDGFTAGSSISNELPMGKDGEKLHEWLFSGKTDIDKKILDELVETSGAVILGRRTYDLGIGDPWGGVSPFSVPAFVVSSGRPDKMVKGFSFINDGIESALNQAKTIAGNKNVWIMGGANLASQYIKAQLIDELHIHLVPLILGAGSRLFESTGPSMIELEKIKSIESTRANHFVFRVIK
jgi:dihydrofolate reductase